MRVFQVLVALAIGLTFPILAYANQDVLDELAPSGRLRVALLVTNSALVNRDTSPADIRGLGPDLGRSLADRLKIPFQPIRFQTAPQILQTAANDVWDVTFLTVDPERAKFVDFTPPYMTLENCLLLPQGSRVTSLTDIDNRDVRIAVYEGSSNSLALARSLKKASMVKVESGDKLLDLLRSGRADVFADNRPLGQQVAVTLPGARILYNPQSVGHYAMAVPKGNINALRYLSEFLDRAKRSGQIDYLIAYSKLAGASAVAAR